VPSAATALPLHCVRDGALTSTSVRADRPLYPRGPRSGPGYAVPGHRHLVGPIRPTRRHIPTSPHSGLYEMPSLCAYTTTPRQPTSGSVLSLSVLYRHVVPWDPGKFIGCMHPVPSPMTLAFDAYGKSRHFHRPHTPILVREPVSRLNCSSLTLRPDDLLASLVGADQGSPQPTEAFTSGLSTGWSLAPPPDMTTVATGQVPPAGFTPTRTSTSIAAPVRWVFPSTASRPVCQTGLPANHEFVAAYSLQSVLRAPRCL